MEDDAVAFDAMPIMAMRAAPVMMAMAVSAPELAMDEAEAAPEPMAAKMKSANAGAADADGAGGAGGAVAVKIRSNFETTPLFLPSLAVGPSGEVHVTWPLPDNTGAYELRAYAVTADSFGGGATTTQYVRKPLTLQASVPRVARVGDRFRCGVT
eukprot:6999800-Prymnesium_polylepis.3